MTKREMFVAIMNVAEVAENADMVEFLKRQIDLLDSRKNTPRKPSAKNLENERIKDVICEVLTDADAPMRVKDMIADERLGDYTTAKISALLRQLLPDTGDGRVVKTVEKKISYFAIA